ncbi:MAG: NAD(P)/FAD-dependent oxidoreductase [Bacteroidota bacterium]
MKKNIELVLTPQQAFGEPNLLHPLAKKLRVQRDEITFYQILRRSIDSRQRMIWVRVQVEVWLHEKYIAEDIIPAARQHVHNNSRVIVIGAGPAGLFASIELIRQGYKPILLERGKDVHERKRSIADINIRHTVDANSNFCFGEGGAGTFSDGKLYTRSTKRGNVRDILKTFVEHGATEDILIEAHPHIGSDKLPAIIEHMREHILEAGGEVHFGIMINDIEYSGDRVTALIDQKGTRHEGQAYILATGHSATDIYELLDQKKIALEFKPFAMGIRVEHPQLLIDQAQYHTKERSEFLPAATYSLVAQAAGRGVFSFCMCPGGIIVPSASGPEQVVVNGMSNSRRNSPFANSGIVVSVEASDFAGIPGDSPLKGLRFQQQIEKLAWLAGGSCQRAPAQRLTDFLSNKQSQSLPDTSYHPGTVSYPINQVLPEFITSRLKLGFKQFEEKLKGFITDDAVILGVESRTSSPVRIPRDPEKMHHIQLKNLYPCGEGSGYAGGIVSSAMDGENAARYLGESLRGKSI